MHAFRMQGGNKQQLALVHLVQVKACLATLKLKVHAQGNFLGIFNDNVVIECPIHLRSCLAIR